MHASQHLVTPDAPDAGQVLDLMLEDRSAFAVEVKPCIGANATSLLDSSDIRAEAGFLNGFQEIHARLGLMNTKRLLPTGECWCGCGTELGVGSFFAQGHDKKAESAVIKIVYGSVPAFLAAMGFGPEGRNADQAYKDWQLQLMQGAIEAKKRGSS